MILSIILDIDGDITVGYIYSLVALGERLKVEELDRTVWSIPMMTCIG